MADNQDKDKLIEALLQERDEMYVELSRLRENDNGALETAENTIREQAEKIKQLTDQLAGSVGSSGNQAVKNTFLKTLISA